MNQPQENKLKVSNPERIFRILQKICQAGLQVTVRLPGAQGLSIRGKAIEIPENKTLTGVKIGGISEKGIQMLATGGKVQIEFIMMSTKVVFQTVILRRESNEILVQIPIALVSIERRKNARFATTPEMLGFISLSIWRSDTRDPLAPPYFSHHESLGHLVSIVDVSSNGLCALARFPSMQATVKSGLTDAASFLHLPMLEPIPMSLQFRWVKKIKETVGDAESGIRQIRSYRFGCEFVNPSEDAVLRIRHFIHQLSQQGAI